MARVISARLLELIPTILVVATLSFVLVQFIPGSPAIAILGDRATPESIARIEAELGLDRPILVQYLDFLGGLAQGDLGQSFISRAPVTDIVMSRFPITFSLSILVVLISATAGVGIGAIAAVRGGLVERILMLGAGVGLALPNFWIGVIFVLIFAITLGVLPATGYVSFGDDPGLWLIHLIMPVTVLAIVQVSSLARQTRSAMHEQFRREYVRSLRSAGISRPSIIWRHCLRNAAIPVVTTLGLQYVGILGGTVVVEQVFALRGIGSLMVESAHVRDIPVLQGVVILCAALVLLVNLLVEIAYFALNPKVRA